MNFRYLSLISVMALSAAAIGQESNTTKSAGSPLQLNQRTDTERVAFLLNVALAYSAEKDFDSAVSAYERILEIDPKHQDARYVIGTVYISAKQYKKAENHLVALIVDYPDNFLVLNNLAWLYATAEDPKIRNGAKAVKLAQEAMSLAPYDHHVWSTLSEAHYINGDYEKAFRAIEQMVQLATKENKRLSKEQVDDYNEQYSKCKRAWNTQKMLEGNEEDE